MVIAAMAPHSIDSWQTGCFEGSLTLSARSRGRCLYRLLCYDEEELEMAKFVQAFIAAATIADLDGGFLRQPNAEFAFVELDWCIRNVEML
jgi:hypothetical protein